MKKNFILSISVLIISFVIQFSLSNTAEAIKIYKWQDKNGVTHVVDDPDKVPPQFRDRAIVIDTKDTNMQARMKTLITLMKLNRTPIISAIIALLVISTGIIVYKKSRVQRDDNRKDDIQDAIKLSGVNDMSPLEFKQFIMDLLERRGFTVIISTELLNPFVDFIAQKEDLMYVVHVSKQTKPISKLSINELDREKYRFDCNHSMFIARSGFTDDAHDLAKSLQNTLIDSDTLGEWILQHLQNN